MIDPDKRIIGVETEYGIFCPADVDADPTEMSSAIVTGYIDRLPSSMGPVRWDYAGEDPMRDARNGTPSSHNARDVMVSATTNIVLPNGGRLYVDHAHPEYSAPETTGPMDATIWDRAGEIVMARAARQVKVGFNREIRLYKNNTDGKGSSYGTHENYLVERSVPFDELAACLIPFFVTRQIFCGSGRVGIGPNGEEAGFQLSQRADFMEALVGVETTVRRPIVNTRDEPHADPSRYRRLHVIIGDANLMAVSTYRKIATTSALLSAIESSANMRRRLMSLELSDAVSAVRSVSRDLTVSELIPLADGRTMSAVDIQRSIAELIADVAPSSWIEDWMDVLDRLDRDPTLCSRDVEWAAKFSILDAMRQKANMTWDDPRMQAMDLQWSDVDPARSIAKRALDSGMVDDLEGHISSEQAADTPPSTTRAARRVDAVSRIEPGYIIAANWESVVRINSHSGEKSRIDLSDPYVFAQDESVTTHTP